MYKLITSFSNLSFMGVPVISAVYGEGAIFFASLGNIPFNVLLYTVGIMLLQSNGEKKEKISIKSMINVPIIATVIATVIFLFEIPMPVIVVDVADMLSDACAPLSMMCIGLSLGSVSIKDAFVHPRIYGINFMRLIVAPVAVWLVLKLFVSDARLDRHNRSLSAGDNMRAARHGLRPRRCRSLGDDICRHGAFNVHNTAAGLTSRTESIAT